MRVIITTKEESYNSSERRHWKGNNTALLCTLNFLHRMHDGFGIRI